MNVRNGTTASKQRKKRKPASKNLTKVPSNSSASNPFRIEWPQTGGNKLVGAYIPRRDADYLNLLAMYKRTTASQILREALDDTIRNGIPEEEIIDSIVHLALTEWQSRSRSNYGGSGWIERIDVMVRWREYQQETRLLLVKRNISDSLIVRIIRKLEMSQGGF